MRETGKSGLSIRPPQLLAWLFIWGIVGITIWSFRGLPYKMEGAPGPGFFPVYLSICLGLLNFFYGAEVFGLRGQKEVIFPRPSEMVRPIGFVLVAVFIIVLWDPLGAVPTVLVSSLVELRFLEGHSWTRSLRIGVSITGLVWVLFEMILEVPLPRGIFEPLFF